MVENKNIILPFNLSLVKIGEGADWIFLNSVVSNNWVNNVLTPRKLADFLKETADSVMTSSNQQYGNLLNTIVSTIEQIKEKLQENKKNHEKELAEN